MRSRSIGVGSRVDLCFSLKSCNVVVKEKNESLSASKGQSEDSIEVAKP